MTVHPTTIAGAEAGIVTRLKAMVGNYAVESFPDNPDTYKLTHQRGAFLVQYRGATHTAGDESDAATERAMLFDITVEARSLTGAGGAYVMLELARGALAGHRIPGFSAIMATRERFIARGEGVWIYAITVATSTLSLPADEDETPGALLARVTLASSLGSTEVTAPA